MSVAIMFENLFSPIRVELGDPSLTGIILDASLSESHKYSSQVTEHPVEDGSNISDNIRNMPESITIEGFVSATPIVSTESTGEAQSQKNAMRMQDAFEKMLKLRDARKTIKVVTGLRVYENMAIKDLDFPRSPQLGLQLKFTIQLQRIILVSNRQVKLRLVPRSPVVDKGHVATEKTDPAKETEAVKHEKLKSAFLEIKDAYDKFKAAGK